MSNSNVLTITMNPSVDIGTEAKEVITDQKTRCEHPVYDAGGGGINVARVLTRLGVKSDAFFISGGYTGELLKQMMAEENISTIPVESSDKTRQNIAIIDNSTGQQYRFVLPGLVSDNIIWKGALETLQKIVHDYDYVVGSGSLPTGVPSDFYSRVGKIVQDAGKKYVLDTSGTALFEGLNSGVDFIKPNQEEFAEMKRIFNIDSDEALCELLFNKGVKNIVHTLGKAKTVLITPNSSQTFIPPSVKVRSTIGAGDSFIGGLIAGLVKGFPENKAVEYGISTAASTLQSEGTDLCDAKEVESIYNNSFGT